MELADARSHCRQQLIWACLQKNLGGRAELCVCFLRIPGGRRGAGTTEQELCAHLQPIMQPRGYTSRSYAEDGWVYIIYARGVTSEYLKQLVSLDTEQLYRESQ